MTFALNMESSEAHLSYSTRVGLAEGRDTHDDNKYLLTQGMVGERRAEGSKRMYRDARMTYLWPEAGGWEPSAGCGPAALFASVNVNAL